MKLFTREEPKLFRTVDDIVSHFTKTISELRAKREELIVDADRIAEEVEILKGSEQCCREEADRAKLYADKLDALFNE